MHNEALACRGKSNVFKEGKSTLRTGTLAAGPHELTVAEPLEPLEPLILQRIAMSKGEMNRGREAHMVWSKFQGVCLEPLMAPYNYMVIHLLCSGHYQSSWSCTPTVS